MSNYNDSIQDRLSRASEAKNAMLAKLKQSLDPENPAAIEKRRERFLDLMIQKEEPHVDPQNPFANYLLIARRLAQGVPREQLEEKLGNWACFEKADREIGSFS